MRRQTGQSQHVLKILGLVGQVISGKKKKEGGGHFHRMIAHSLSE